MSHAPVMLDEAVTALNPRDGGLYVDATFGAGGYSRAILSAAECRVLALDRDPAVRFAGEQVKALFPGRFVLVGTAFSNMEHVVRESGGEHVDGVVMDIGVSSMQLDQAERGFSFAKPGPLDMRMGGDGATAADAVNALGRDELADIFFNYGEEKRSRRVADAILKARAEAPIDTTDRLAEIVAAAVGGGHHKIHPATRVFQALRIFVNDELGELERALAAAERLLRPGGHLVVVSFHSLEDRIVKAFLRKRAGLESHGSRHLPQVDGGPAPSFKMLFMGAKPPSEEEVAENRRARSAKLRAAVRTDADPFPESRHTPLFVRLTPEALL